MIGRVQNTPGSVLIDKTKYDIWIACVKQGYQQATLYNHSGVAAVSVGNVLAGGFIGWAVDSATGSDNRYDSPVNITLMPVQPGQPQAPASLPDTFVGVMPPPSPQAAPAQQPPVQPPPAGQQTPGQTGPLTD